MFSDSLDLDSVGNLDTVTLKRKSLKCKFDVQIVKLVGQFKGSAFVCLEISSACPDTSVITVTFLSSQRTQILNNQKLLLTWINAEISPSGADICPYVRLWFTFWHERQGTECLLKYSWIQIRNKSRVKRTFFLVQVSRKFKGQRSSLSFSESLETCKEHLVYFSPHNKKIK